MTPEEESKPEDLDSTAELFRRAREGDESARNALIDRCWVVLRRVAHGRLPRCVRGLVETQDIVQNVMVNALPAINRFEPRHSGAFLVYLRRCVINEIHTQVRKAKRRPSGDPIPEDLVSDGPSPIEDAIGSDAHALYERGLATLDDGDQEVLIAHVEMGLSHAEIGKMLTINANAARMRVVRALLRLAEAMRKLGHGK